MDESGAATTSRFTRRDELATTSEYRALSLWALASLAVGLLSLFAFLSPLFWLLPLAGVAVGTMTLRQLHLNRDRFTGSRLAWCGLAISLVTLGWHLLGKSPACPPWRGKPAKWPMLSSTLYAKPSCTKPTNGICMLATALHWTQN